MTNTTFPQKELRALSAALKLNAQKELPVLAEMETAIAAENFEAYKALWEKTVGEMRTIETLEWNKLFAQILVALEMHHKNYTVSKKQRMLRKVLSSKNLTPEALFERLEKLMQTWGGKKTKNQKNPKMKTILLTAFPFLMKPLLILKNYLPNF